MAVNPWVPTLVLLVVAAAVSIADSNETKEFCPTLQPQKTFDIDELMRKWYVAEVMEHKHVPMQQTMSGGSGDIMHIESCPVVHLQRIEENRLRMLWDEKAGLVEYHFRLPIPYSPGYWVAEGLPNSTLADNHGKHIEVQFSGDVRVMKAVASHLVLTFCSAAEEKLWTIVLSLEKTLSTVDMLGVNKMLERRGLPLSNVRQTCSSASISNAAPLALFVMLLVAGIAVLGSL